MQLKLRLTVVSFLQFFVWGSWLTSIAVYLDSGLHFTGAQVGSIFSTLGLAALFMPGILGVLADRYIPAHILYGICHVAGAGALFAAAGVNSYDDMFSAMLLNSMAYMPTIALSNSISYQLLTRAGHDVVSAFPPIRVWGTIGFILAMWVTDMAGWTANHGQLLFAAGSSLVLGLYSFTLPKCEISRNSGDGFLAKTGLKALALFQKRQMAVFFLFAMLIGAALQVTNLWGQAFLEHFKSDPAHSGSFAVTHPGILLSVSQVSETVFILTIPFFLRRFGIKKVMLFSILAWLLRFSLFGIGNPGAGFVFLLLSMIVYGMAFDFFNISGSLFVENETDASIRSSAQGLFMMMTNGLGSILGGTFSGMVVDAFTLDNARNWPAIWMTFAAYALILAFLFALLFRKERRPQDSSKEI